MFGSNKEKSLLTEYFKSMCDIASFPAGSTFQFDLFKDRLEMTDIASKQKVTLNYEKFTSVFYGMKSFEEIVNKNSIGRAVAGGLLFGGVGAVVGAASGAGSKKENS